MIQQTKRESYQVMLPDGSVMNVDGQLQGRDAASEFLESGGIIYFPESPFRRKPADARFLLTQYQKDASYHKNIAYRPLQNKVTGLQAGVADQETLRRIMSEFSDQAVQLVEQMFPAYVHGYKLDFASYRPIEEKGRKMRLRARNDLIHVDSFATRPVKGDRILRVFENINPDQVRVWRTSDTFEELARQFKHERKAPGDLEKEPSSPWLPRFITRALGLKASGGSGYDSWMLSFHNFLKENKAFQSQCRKAVWQFPPGSSWIVYTDMTSHSVLSGQYALEQTFIVSQKSMVLPEKAPINILRRLYG